MKKQLTQDEITQLELLQDEYSLLIANIGQVEISIILLEKQLEDLKLTQKVPLIQKLDQLQKNEIKLAQELTSKYGEGNIDLKTGEIHLK